MMELHIDQAQLGSILAALNWLANAIVWAAIIIGLSMPSSRK